MCTIYSEFRRMWWQNARRSHCDTHQRTRYPMHPIWNKVCTQSFRVRLFSCFSLTWCPASSPPSPPLCHSACRWLDSNLRRLTFMLSYHLCFIYVSILYNKNCGKLKVLWPRLSWSATASAGHHSAILFLIAQPIVFYLHTQFCIWFDLYGATEVFLCYFVLLCVSIQYGVCIILRWQYYYYAADMV